MDDFNERIQNWPTLGQKPIARAVLKAQPADFKVFEDIGFELDRDGDHLCLEIEKTNLNTSTVIDCLIRVFAVKQVDIGYFGLKDKQSVSSQWFSVHMPGQVPDQLIRGLKAIESQLLEFLLGSESIPDNLDDRTPDKSHAQLSVLKLERHTRKFRPGQHNANRFEIRLTDVQGQTSVIDQAMADIGVCGFPNYFGPQRFGFNSSNLDAAHRLLAQNSSRRRKISRTKRSMLLSAARSFLFNEVLAERLRCNDWLALHADEILMLRGSKSIFTVSESDCRDSAKLQELQGRLNCHDVQLTGPLWGQNQSESHRAESSRRQQIEDKAIARYPVLAGGLVAFGLKLQRRALRACASELSYQWNETGDLELEFTLPPGVYATSLIREIVDVGN